MYNDKVFRSSSKVSIIFSDTPINSINCAASQTHNNMPTDKDLFNNSIFDVPSIEKNTTLKSTINKINNFRFKNEAFFIQFISYFTKKAGCYLVQVGIKSTLSIIPLYKKMVNTILCALQIIQMTNIKTTNSVYGGSIGTITAIERKKDKYYIATGS